MVGFGFRIVHGGVQLIALARCDLPQEIPVAAHIVVGQQFAAVGGGIGLQELPVLIQSVDCSVQAAVALRIAGLGIDLLQPHTEFFKNIGHLSFRYGVPLHRDLLHIRKNIPRRCIDFGQLVIPANWHGVENGYTGRIGNSG